MVSGKWMVSPSGIWEISVKLQETGFESTLFSLTDPPEIPDTGVLVIASPQIRLLEGEVKRFWITLPAAGICCGW